MTLDRTSTAAQDYLKALWLAEREAGAPVCPTSVVARRLDVSAASATNMLKKLDSMGLVDHVHYRGAALTDRGRKVALEVVRHHRLLETYLAEALAVPWDEVHAEAEILEHVLSESLEERIAAALGNPTRDPHGHPIPARDGAMPAPDRVPMTDLQPGCFAVVAEVSDRDPELLTYLEDIGLTPGRGVTVIGAAPFEGPIEIGVGDEVLSVGRPVADAVLVSTRGESVESAHAP